MRSYLEGIFVFSKSERKIMRRYEARRILIDQRTANASAAKIANQRQLDAQLRPELLRGFTENIARLLAFYDEHGWEDCQSIVVPRKVFISKTVPAIEIGTVMIPVEHLKGDILVSQPVVLTIGGEFFGFDSGMYTLVDLGTSRLTVLREILDYCQQLQPKRS